MNKTKIFTYVLLIPIIFLAYKIYDGIRGPIMEQRRIESIEARVIDRLKMLRNLQLGYYSVHQRYAGTWDELVNFINKDRFLNIQRTETIDSVDARGIEYARVKLDTLGTVPVKDSLFPESRYPNFDPKSISTIPGSGGKQFELFGGKVRRNNLEVDVFEIRDVAPVNPARRRNNNERALKVGSREEASTAGNWE
jgi:hypothetical protein